MHKVKCLYCGNYFDSDKEEYVKPNSRRYAHKSCADNLEQEKEIEKTDEQKLDDYIMFLFSTEYVLPNIRKQINSYVRDYHYTYSGILKALIYHYEIKKMPIEKSRGGIGIVPYVYDEAKAYYYNIWLAQESNKEKDISAYIPNTIEIIIPPPSLKKKKRKLFSFLDEGE